jgi:hypothetical protein
MAHKHFIIEETEKMTTTTKVREYECDNEQDEELIGVIHTELQFPEDNLLARMIEQAVADTRLSPTIMEKGKRIANPLVEEAFAWLFLEDENDIHAAVTVTLTPTPLLMPEGVTHERVAHMTFPWICNELGWDPERFRAPLRRKFERLFV